MTDQTSQILVVDDDMMARMATAQCVKQQGHSVTMAEGGAQALELLGAQAFNLVLLDLKMPDMDGFDVLEQMQGDEKLRQIPVLVVSGSDQSDSIDRCIELGAVGHIAKPVDPEALIAQVNASLVECSG